MIYWHSPLDDKKSAISFISKSLIKFINQEHNIKTINENTICKRTGVHIYNIGNHYENHRYIWWNSILKSGIVILHDSNMYDFFFGLFNESCFKSSDRINFYNNLFVNYNNSPNYDFKFNYCQLAVLNSAAIIVHNKFTQKLLSEFGFNNVYKLELPYVHKLINNRHRNQTESKIFKILIFGFIGYNRFIYETIDIINEINCIFKVELHIAGKLSCPKLNDFVKKSNNVTYHGYVLEIDKLIQSVDLGVNIRYPSMGECSESLLRYWANKKTCVVVDSMFYSEISNKFVLKVRKGFEKTDLKNLIFAAYNGNLDLFKMGNDGFDYLCRNHSQENYISSLFNIIKTNPTLYYEYIHSSLSKSYKTII